ncbi:MAG: family 20 glycosylhydrolase [Faecalibacillus faecis]
MREILAEAKNMVLMLFHHLIVQVMLIEILKAHPEYGQVNTSGNHYKSGLDVTNPEAIAYIRSLYDEYMDLFEGCTDFHIGGDEYMEFDRAPFTTEYKSVLNSYAVKKYGQGYIWKDVIAGYINDLAEYVHNRGFTPRIWNDGVYYGENSYEGAQK